MDNISLLVLDFDGVLADSDYEGLLIAWNGFHHKDLADFSLEGLQTIPQSFAQRFHHCRKFVRHLAHCSVPFYDQTSIIKSTVEFEAIFNSIPQSFVENFVDSVSRYRHLVRQEKMDEWLNSYYLYPGIRDFLRQLSCPFYIVTANDKLSILKILELHQIDLAEKQVLGGQIHKNIALSEIQKTEKIEQNSLCFIDDNIINVLKAKKAGYKVYWATWGYNVAEHHELAEKHTIPSLSLTKFVEFRPQNYGLSNGS